MEQVFQYFEFKKEILALERAGLLREVINSFKAVDLHPDIVCCGPRVLVKEMDESEAGGIREELHRRAPGAGAGSRPT